MNNNTRRTEADCISSNNQRYLDVRRQRSEIRKLDGGSDPAYNASDGEQLVSLLTPIP